ncbi:MAG: hypothetical protein ABI586_03150 [Candidatus Nanopelagicales bacterium]
MRHEPMANDMYVDVNGCLTEHVVLGSHEVIVHYDDVPESDITTIDGLRCTTALRTVIDIAPEMDQRDLARVVRDCLERQLFSVSEAMARTAEPDMSTRPGALLLRQALPSER